MTDVIVNVLTDVRKNVHMVVLVDVLADVHEGVLTEVVMDVLTDVKISPWPTGLGKTPRR